MEKDTGVIGSLLTDAHDDLYGSKITALEFHEVTNKGFKVEWTFRDDDLVIHLYSRNKWPFDYVKKLYPLMDELAAGESRDIGYEDLPDSWYIISKDFGSGKLYPEAIGEKLCRDLLKRLS